MIDIFTPAPPMETMAERIARQPSRIPFPNVARPGHPAFVGPLRAFRQSDMYDPRPNVPGVTYWGD